MRCQHKNSKIRGVTCEYTARFYFIPHAVNALTDKVETGSGIPVCPEHCLLLISQAMADDHKTLWAFTVHAIDKEAIVQINATPFKGIR